MGNHSAGRAMVQTATALAHQRSKTGQTALEILDIACRPYERCDAEFDDDAVPGELFGNLITEAFAPDLGVEGAATRMADMSPDDAFDWWYNEVYEKFSNRYSLC